MINNKETSLMSIDEVADLLGVSRGLVYQWCRKDLIPHYVLGFGRDGRKSAIRFNRDRVTTWLEAKANDSDVPSA
jgi:excisionase family DNA binding protein